jgi:hypothetical protein
MPQITSAIMVAVALVAGGLLVRHPGPITREWRGRMFGNGGAPPRASSGAPAG